MDVQVQTALEQHEEYARLRNIFEYDFVVNCLTNSKRGPAARQIGDLLRSRKANSSFLISEIHFHELAELEELRKIGYSDERLGENHEVDPNLSQVQDKAQARELVFCQDITQRVLDICPPFIGWLFARLSLMPDYGFPEYNLDDVCRIIQRRGDFYKQEFTLEQVAGAIRLYKLGDEICSREASAIGMARDYLSGRRPADDHLYLASFA